LSSHWGYFLSFCKETGSENLMEEELFTEIFENDEALVFLGTLKKLRAGIYVDPSLNDPWSCDGNRCRPFLGRNLCCKVETRCKHFTGDSCSIHETKPFSCALFPVDLLRIGRSRVVVSAKNPLLYEKNWSRYDRDMLRCFDGEIIGKDSEFIAQLPILKKVFTMAEIDLIERGLAL
jgi:hypothetical protein